MSDPVVFENGFIAIDMNTILRKVCGNICEMSTFAEALSIHTDTTVYERTQRLRDYTDK